MRSPFSTHDRGRVFALAVALSSAACASSAVRAQEELVDVGALDPGLVLDMRYARPDNFLGRAVYDEPRCLLVPDAARRLLAAERALRAEGFRLVVWDCYRPLSVQREMWKILPDPTYVADPARGSRHNRGAAVDVGLLTLDGTPVPLPTGHDDFTPRAHRDATDLPVEAIAGRERLERAMESAGWIPLPSEWWHFDAEGWEAHPILDLPL
ncbi:MAG TPA: M15 family metallopeptidase [Gemmatimonadota bacterium]|nr:M15 family metallopeptidase [Gemmatimonadota bacterium]